MPLPDSFHTPERLIKHALRDAGRLQFNAEPTPEVYQDAMDRLADLILAFQVSGLKLWLNYMRTFTLVAGTHTYELTAPRELRVPNAWFVMTDGNRRPIHQLAWENFHTLGDLTQEGQPVHYFVDKQRATPTIRFWPVPDASAVAAGSIEAVVQTQATAPVTLDEEIQFPPEWYMALRWGLADELASGQPVQIMERCQGKAMEYKRLLEDWDVEDGSTFFVPEVRQHEQSRFRR